MRRRRSPVFGIRGSLVGMRGAKSALVLLLSMALMVPQAVISPSVAVAAPTPSLSVKVRFQPDSATPADGYTKDIGAAYSDAAGMGWVRQDSLAGTHVPLNLTLNTRLRGCTALPVPQQTFIHMQAPATTSTNDSTPGAWEYKLANGRYQVTVGVGDPNTGSDPEKHVINVEGVRAVDQFPSSATTSCNPSRLKTATVLATVTDGLLTVDAVGGTNTKLAFVTIDAVSVSDITATPGAASIAVDWADAPNATGYRIWRGTNLPVVTTGQPLATTTASEFVDATAGKGTSYFYAVSTATSPYPDYSRVPALVDDASPAAVTLPATFDFVESPGVTTTSTSRAGFIRDYGQNYANVRGYGWITPGTSLPASLVGNGRARVAGSSDPLNSMIHMQYGTIPNANLANGVPESGAWQVAVPNGSYDVTVAVGDVSASSDAMVHHINLEGVAVVDLAVPTATSTTRTAVTPAVRVQVTDGFLTVDAIGGTNTKLAYVTVAATPADPAPAAPTGLVATAGDNNVALDWADNTDADLAGYNVFRGTTAPVATTGTPLNGATPLAISAFTDTTAVNDTAYIYVVVARDAAGQSSAASTAATATPDAANPTLPGLPLKINFNDNSTLANALAASTIVTDDGQPFSNVRGRGWVSPTTGAALSLVGNGRLRPVRTGVTVDPRQRSLVHMQGADVVGSFAGVRAPGAYEIAVPNGSYRVTVSVGDQPGSATASCVTPCYDSRHTINVEGVKAIDRFQATAAAEFRTVTTVVPVSDGRLTVDATGGTNTKINYLDIETADVTAPTVPTGLTVAPGEGTNTVTWTPVNDPGAVTYTLYSATTDEVAVTAANLRYTGPLTTFEHTGLVNGTKVNYVVTATDAAGNVSAASPVASGTPQDATAPAAPTGVVAVAGDRVVSLRWTAVDEAAGYRVYRSTTSPVALTAANRIADAFGDVEYTDADRTNDVALYYVVTAVDAAGNESVASAEKTATPTMAADVTAPVAPVGLTAVAGDARVSLSWTANTDSDLAGYLIYRSSTAGTPGTPLTPGPVLTTTFADTTAANATRYFYVVTAVDAAGNESAGSNEVDATPTDTTAPAVPSGVTATAGRHSVTVRWTVNAETDVRGYRVYRWTGDTPAIDDAHLAGVLIQPGRTFVDSDLVAGTRYSYAVMAYDLVGNRSAASTTVSAVPLDDPDTTAPGTVTGVVAAVVDSRVNVSWSPSTATDLAGYNVYRSAAAGGTRVKLTSAPQTATIYTDLSAPAGVTSYYTVTAVDAAGNESNPSAEISAALPSAGVDVKFSFQPATAAALAGYTPENGAAFSTTRGYGWVRQDSLASTTVVPLDLTTNTRQRFRAAPVTDLQNRMIHLQYGDIVPTPTSSSGSLVPAAWEYGLPNGRYTVAVSVGDQPGASKTGCPTPCYDSQHTIRAEGVSVINRFQATAAQEYGTGTATVDVTDGTLTIDAIGGTNTKLNWITIASTGPVVPDTTAPGAPSGVLPAAGNASVTLTWTAPTATDLAGYNVYRSTSATFTPGVGNKANVSGPVATTNFTDTGLTNGTRYYYLVTAVDQAGNESVPSALQNATPSDAAPAAFAVKIDYTDAATTPPAGYLRDYGQAFGPRSGTNQGTGLSFGWLALATDAPTSLEGNGRNRNVVGPGNTTVANQADLRLASFVHMQLAAATNGGSTTPGKWEMVVPNGAYTVTVAVGDAGAPVDSANWVNIENQNAIAAFTPTTANKFATATRTVVVADGRLTLTPAGGTNTKIAYVDIDSLDLGGRPYTSAVTPANGATEVVTNASVTSDNNLNAETGAVDEATLGGGTVKLTRVADGVAVPGTGATSGGGDTVAFQASAPLAGNTLYRFEISAGVKDKSGRAFMPFSSVFTTSGAGTGGGTGTIPPNVAFDRVDSGAAKGAMYTSIVMGPDGKLYAGSITGEIYRWTVNADGTLSNRQTITTVRTHATDRGWEGAPNRTIIGLTFDPASTPTNLILWITDNYAYLGDDVPDVTGAVSKLTGPNLENYQEVVVNLPRSIKDHETNSIAFKDGKLYITQGSMNAMGNIDGTWKRAEHLLSASLLELDPAKLPTTLPLDVATPDVTAPARGGVPQHVGTYNPYAAGAPLTLYATGIRNAFDLVWHSNGHLYTGTNGSAAGGSTPATPATLPASCANRPEGSYTGPTAPGIANNQQAETDYMFDVTRNKYYGHPNPARCEYVLNAGNPAGYTGNPLYKVNQYPLGQLADPNYDLAGVNDAGLHASANGTIEYLNTAAFGGALAGKLITVRYSANQEVVAFVPNADGSLSKAVTGITGFTGFKQPLDIAQNVDNGFLYVTELTDNPATTGIQLLKPQGGSGSTGKAEPTARLVFTELTGGAASAAQNVAVKNIGGAPLTLSAAAITGPDAALFARSGGPTLPLVLAAGATATFPVTFNPTTAGPRGAVFTVTTDGPTTPTVTTVLRGLGAVGNSGTAEPSLQWILDTLQIPVNVGDPDPTNNDLPVSSAPIGDEVAVTSFTKAAFDRVVQVQAISLFGPNGPTANPNVVTVGVHATADTTARTTLLRGPNTSNQTVLPTMTTVGEYDLETPFGFDFTWHGLSDRTAWSEDALNTWDATNKHKVRVYPLKNADGTVEANAYIVAPEDVLTPVDFQDAAVIVRNVKPAPVAGAGKIAVAPSELVFSAVRSTVTAAKTLTVTNSGTTPLNISDARISGANGASFTLTGGTQTIAAGGTGTYTVRFNPGSTSPVGYQSATLTLTSDDATRPTLAIGLYGLATPGEQGDNEPTLKAVVDTLGRPIDVGGTGLILGTNPAPIGDEVIAPLFVKAGTGQVGITPVARYSPDELLPFGWYTAVTGDALTRPVATIATDNEQTLNPAIVAGGATGFDPGTDAFGIYVDSMSFGRKSFTQDGLNTNIPHAARIYPAKDRAGAVIANTYLVAFEDAQNGDYQDYVFEVTNVRPASSTGPTTPVARIDFQPATSTVATGYTADTGAAFSAAAGRGWVVPGSATPLDMTAQTRERAGTADIKLRTVLLMQPTAAQSPNGPGAWEYAVPNGSYVVTVGAGDPGFTDSVHQVRVEGTTAVSFTPTTAEPSRTGTVTVTVTDGKLTVDAIGGSNTKLQFVDIDRPSVVAGDTVAPTVTWSLTGLQASPGVYKNTVDIAVVASDAGSGVGSRAYSLDGAAFAAYTAPVTVTAVGAHTLRVRAIDVAGNVTTSGTLNFSIVAAGVSQAEISLANADGVPFADRLVMSRIQTPETGRRCRDVAACDPVTGPFFPVNVVHDVGTLTIRNTGTEPLNVTALTVTGPFALASTITLPALVAVNGTLSVPVRFNATTIGTAGGLWNGTLTVASDDADEPSLPVELAGFWQSQSENNQEPNVAEIARLFGYGTQITANGVPLDENGLVHATADEVLSPYWQRVDTTQPVSVRQLAAYHTQGNTATFRWHFKGSTGTGATNVFTHLGVEGQSVLPHLNGSTTAPAAGTFTPTGLFGLQIDGEWSDPTRNTQTADVANGCAGPCGHHVRIWAARDRAGAVIANTWLVGMDYSGINYDYNDNVYLVSNMKPELAVNPGTPAPLPGAAQLRLGFDAAYPGTLTDKDGETTGFVSTQPNRLDLATGSNSYNRPLIDVSTAAPGTLAVTSSGTATAGSNGATDNTLVNGLRLPFDATGGTFTVSGRVLGAVTRFDAGSEQQGIQLGPDQDNFVKLAVINRSGVPGIEFTAEQAGAGTTVGAVNLANPATITSVDLALVGTASARTVKAAYRINDGAWTTLPATLTLPAATAGKFFATRADAGILVTHKGGAPFVATFDGFGVDAGDVTTPAPAQEALYRLDVAGAGNYTDSQGRLWTPDTGRFTPTTAIAEGATTTPLEIAGTTDDVLFRTYRGNVGNVAQAQRVLNYVLPARGATTVDVRLYFAERAAANNTAGKRVFDISVEGRTVRSGFDVFAAAGGQNTATVLPINDVTITGGRLELGFSASVDYPSIAAIEVLCKGVCPVDTTAPAAPTALTGTAATTGVTLDWADNTDTDLAGYDVYRATSATGTFSKVNATPLTASTYVDTTATANSTFAYQVTAVDSSENTSGRSNTVTVTTPAPPAQTAIYLNAGGPSQTVNGTTWQGCTAVTACNNWVSGGNAYAENDTITGIPAGLNNTMFQSEWTGSAAVGARAFGYQIPVLNGSYQVRLYYAELNKTAAGTRTFDVRLEGTTVAANFDVFAQAGGIDRAIVRSYNATVTDGAVTIDFIRRVENAKISAIAIVPVDTTAPGAVTGVTATGTSGGVDLAWGASSAADLAGYNVYRSTSATGTFAKVNTTLLTGTTFTDTTAPATAAFYQVTSVDQSGNESARSATVSATRTDTTAPAVVTGLTAIGDATSVTVGWSASAATDLAGYRVYRSSSATGTFSMVSAAVVTGTTYADSTAPLGSSYYQVTAVDQAGNESVRSSTVTGVRGDTTAPGTVVGVSATAAATGITVGWTASAATDLAGYYVYRSSSATGTYTRLTATVATGTTYADTTAATGVASFYQVTAVDQAGNESVRSATVSATRPSAPATATTVRINTGGPAQTVNGTTWSACTAITACSGWVSGGNAYAESDIISGIPAGLNNTMFQSEWTGSAAVGARAFGFQVPVVNGAYQVRLYFTELNKTAAGARTFDVRLENTAVLSNFDVFAAAGGIDRAIVRQFSTTVTDGAVTIDFIRRVENAKISAIEIVPLDSTAPAAVTGVTAAGSSAAVTLGWSASAATDLGGYNVYRATSATGTYAKVNAALITGTTYADSAAPAGATSFYQVTAVDMAGNESVRSSTVSGSRPAATRPTIRINTGGAAVTTGGVTWSADQFFTGGKTYTNPRVTAIAATTDDEIFRSERSNSSFSYAIPAANGVYDVRLNFAELYHGATGGGPGGAGKRVFSVNIEGGTVELANFDINAAAGAMTAVTRTYRMTITDGVVNIAFTSTVDQANIGGIELLPVG